MIRHFQYKKICSGRDYLQAHYTDSFSLAKVAEHSCMSQYHFSRVFTKVFGESPNAFVARLRIEKAKKMLSNITESVRQSPTYHSNWAMLQGKIEQGVFEVAIVGKDATKLANEMQKHYLPNCLYIGGTEENLPLLNGRLTDGTTIYVCKDKVCNLPTTEVEKAVGQVIGTARK